MTGDPVELFRPPKLPQVDRIGLIVAASLFAAAGILFIPYLGVQNDESLFATVIYGPVARNYRLRAFDHDVPLMLMTYLGTVKSWLYALVFSIWQPSVWSVRIPPVLAGAATIVLFGKLLWKSCGRTAMWIGAILLTLDPSFLLTTTFDWGPVAIQHLLMTAGLYLIFRFTETYSLLYAGAAFFCFGAALWDKALFSWSVAGLGLASVLVFWQEAWVLLKPRHIAAAVLGFAIGVWPLALYNARNQGATFAGNATLVPAELPGKAVHLRSTLDGSALFGYLIREEWETKNRQPESSMEKASVWIREFAGERRRGAFPLLLLVCLALAPVWWKYYRRPVLFALIYCTVAWTLMAMTKDAGGSAHHVVLLWPMPHFLAASALAAVADRSPRTGKIVVLLAGIVLLQNALVLNQYLSQAIRHGSGPFWTEAIFPLRDWLANRKPKAANILDWGMDYSLLMLEEGRIPMRTGMQFHDPPGEGESALVKELCEEQDAVWVTHVSDLETTPGQTRNVLALAMLHGYDRRMLATIPDRMGRPIFEVFELRKQTAALAPQPPSVP